MPIKTWDLGNGAYLDLNDWFLESVEALRLLVEVSDLPWQQREIRLFGKPVLEPRQTVWVGDSGATYRYSGRTNQPVRWTPRLLALRARVEAATGQQFNSCLLNHYRDGKDSIGPHADDEPELGPRPTIASVSLGVPRRFQVRPKVSGQRLDLDLHHGSLLVMRGTMQQHYRHCVPKQPKVLAPRTNLTFRWIESA